MMRTRTITGEPPKISGGRWRSKPDDRAGMVEDCITAGERLADRYVSLHRDRPADPRAYVMSVVEALPMSYPRCYASWYLLGFERRMDQMFRTKRSRRKGTRHGS